MTRDISSQKKSKWIQRLTHRNLVDEKQQEFKDAA